MNTIASAHLRDLVPGVQDPGALVVSGQLFTFGVGEMPMLLPHEQLVLAALVRATRPHTILEYGTAQGQTTFLLAANSPDDTRVVTLDLDPAHWGDYARRCLRGDDAVGACYRGSPHAGKVTQLLRPAPDRDPEALADWRGQVDFVLVDGDHSYAGVRRDTESALALAAPDALFAWHDFYGFPSYLAEGAAKRGVFPYLNELAATRQLQLFHVAGTYLVLGRRRWPTAVSGVVHQPGEGPDAFRDRILRLGQC